MTDVNQVLLPRLDPLWDRHIAADLISEIERYVGDVKTMPEMRRLLAENGYKGLQNRIERSVTNLSGVAAVRAMAHAMRGYALANPGLAAASFRTLDATSPEWESAGAKLAETVINVFATCGMHGQSARHGVLILRSLVRGFVVNELTSPNHSLDFQSSYTVAVEMFIAGLTVLGPAWPQVDEALG